MDCLARRTIGNQSVGSLCVGFSEDYVGAYFDDHTFDNLGHVDVGAWRLNMYLPKYPAIITAKMPQKGSVYKLWFDPCRSND